MLWIRLFTQLSSMAANALSAPQKRKHLPWQRSQHQTLLKRSRSRLQSLGTHSLGTECHFIEGMNITRVIRTTTQWILHLVCQEHPEKHMFLAYLTREAPTISYLSAALTCFGSTLILSVISKTFTASTFSHGQQTTTNPLLQSMAFFEFDCVSVCCLDSLPS